jgi:uncharacterized protein
MSEAPVSPSASELAPPPPPAARPVQEQERIRSIDVLRGLALLGILPVNIIAFAHIEDAYQFPTLAGGFTGVNYFVWLFTHVVFEGKMVSLFSMLFGAGLFLQVDRAERRRGRVGSARGLYFRRVGWLLLFGLAHAYLLWYGDILTYYALIGMLVYWMRRLYPLTLFLTGSILILLGPLLIVGLLLLAVQPPGSRPPPEPAAASASPGGSETPPAPDEAAKKRRQEKQSPAKIAEREREIREAGFFDLVRIRAPLTLFFEVKILLAYGLWRILGLMLWGIALVKWHGLSAQWSPRAYRACILVGFGIGLLLTLLSVGIVQLRDFALFQTKMAYSTIDYFGSLFMAAGYFGLIMLIVQKGWLSALQDRLAAVGQMAFTNYLTHTLICTFIFHGWGLGQFGLWPRSELFLLVLSIWLLQLIISPIWLRYFHFGPFEWIWRTLTYWRPQPFVRRRQPMASGSEG